MQPEIPEREQAGEGTSPHNTSLPQDRTTHRAILAERRRILREELAPALQHEQPLVWEIGCGHGHFLAAYAQAHADRHCIGIDIAGDRIERAVRKRDRAGLVNLHFLHAEAGLFLETLDPIRQIGTIFILFPDPWPKSRHHKHRLIQSAFLDTAARHATPDCHLYFRTDHAPYHADALKTLSSHPRWEVVDTPWPFEFETVFQSRAETYQSIVARRRA